MKQVNIFDFIEDDYIPSYDISKYQVKRINSEGILYFIITLLGFGLIVLIIIF